MNGPSATPPMSPPSAELLAALARIPWITPEQAGDAEYRLLGEGRDHRALHLRLGGHDFVLRPPSGRQVYAGYYREEHHNLVWAHLAGVAPAVHHFDPNDGLLLSDYVPGPTLAQVEIDTTLCSRLGGLFALLHAAPPFLYHHEITGRIPRLRRRLAEREGLEPKLRAELEGLCDAVEAARGALLTAPVAAVPCHNDPMPANIIDAKGIDKGGIEREGGLVLIDWQLSGMGDPHVELANLANHLRLDAPRVEALLSSYLKRANLSEAGWELPAARLTAARPVVALYLGLRRALDLCAARTSAGAGEAHRLLLRRMEEVRDHLAAPSLGTALERLAEVREGAPGGAQEAV